MSVDYRSMVAYGWVVEGDEVANLPEDIYEEWMDNEYLLLQNSWNGDGTCIFILDYIICDEDRIVSLSNHEWPKLVDVPFKVNLFKKYFPNRADEKPELLLLMQVN